MQVEAFLVVVMRTQSSCGLALQMSLILATLQTMLQTSGHMASRSFCSVSMLLSRAVCSSAAAMQFSLASKSARILATSPLRTCQMQMKVTFGL